MIESIDTKLEFFLNCLSPWVAIAIAVCGVIRTNVAFSLWDSQGKRQPEASDTYSLFTEIAEELCCNERTKRFIIIEDLDRISDKPAVIEFLKEVYKFQSLLPEESKDKLVFIISVKPEHKLVDDRIKKAYGDHLYSKVFDYIVMLPSVHTLDYAAVPNPKSPI